jgi:hypothetical protein
MPENRECVTRQGIRYFSVGSLVFPQFFVYSHVDTTNTSNDEVFPYCCVCCPCFFVQCYRRYIILFTTYPLIFSFPTIYFSPYLLCLTRNLVPPTQDQWNAAIQKAKDYLTTSAFTNAEKSDLATGVGWEGGILYFIFAFVFIFCGNFVSVFDCDVLQDNVWGTFQLFHALTLLDFVWKIHPQE